MLQPYKARLFSFLDFFVLHHSAGFFVALIEFLTDHYSPQVFIVIGINIAEYWPCRINAAEVCIFVEILTYPVRQGHILRNRHSTNSSTAGATSFAFTSRSYLYTFMEERLTLASTTAGLPAGANPSGNTPPCRTNTAVRAAVRAKRRKSFRARVVFILFAIILFAIILFLAFFACGVICDHSYTPQPAPLKVHTD